MFLGLIFIVAFTAILIITKYLLKRRRRKNTIAFFHLHCSSGGGGERVLWHSIEAILRKYPNHTVYIYSHKNVKDDTLKILLKVRDLFKIDLTSNRQIIDQLQFVPLSCSPLIESKRYPFLTLFFQSLGSVILACEAAYRLVPEVYIETIGFTFTLPIFKYHQCTVITYVHYPTISNDMIHNVQTGSHAAFNNREIFVRSQFLRHLKVGYYKVLAYLYGLAGRHADLVLVNSSWTQDHIKYLWKTDVIVVYPPCDVESFKSVRQGKDVSSLDALNIISIAQFRPEKNHKMQIEAFDLFMNKTGTHDSSLTLYGGCRDEEDKKRVKELKDYIQRLDLESNVKIVVGASFEMLLAGIKDADVAIHTMKNEHFGIVLLECMAAGLITVAHNSGGPKTDIIDDNENGFLANDMEDFAQKLILISDMSRAERIKMSELASLKSEIFSTQVFEERFIGLVDRYISKAHN